MEIFGSIGYFFQVIFVNPITNLLVAFYLGFSFIHIPYSLSFAIIALTVFIRVLLYPLTAAQIRSSRRMQEVAPKINQVRSRYKNDKSKQQQEIMKIYREQGINPASGCLPLLIQIPIIWSLYSVLITIFNETGQETLLRVNEIVYFPFLRILSEWNLTFFEVPLSVIPKDNFASQPFYVVIPIITGVLQFVLSKMMAPKAQTIKPREKQDDFQAVFQKQLIYIFPFMIGWFSFVFPVGLSLYWNTFTLFGILQQYKLVGFGAFEDVISRLRKG